MRRMTAVAGPAIAATVPALAIGITTGLWWIAACLWVSAGAVSGFRLAFSRRKFLSWGYVERADDLYVTHGVLARSLVAVPYGRMQLIEVGSGPLQRAYGLATVTLRTAAPRADARIPGLNPAEAVRLRDRLTELGESQALTL